MTELQTALSSLKRTSYSDVPIHDLANYLQNAFQQAELIINSVPTPPGGDDFSTAHRTRDDPLPASKAPEMTASKVRPPPPSKVYADLQKAWGKPMKLGARDNPLGVSVFKMAGHDRHGAWFARRSVHEGLGFLKWKRAMQSEFPESLAVHKGPGEGSIRGIGGDRVLERKEVENLGKLEVLELSAKFPPPTSPRDFVTLLLTTDSGLSDHSAIYLDSDNGKKIRPRSWMVVSIPMEHPDAPPRDGLVRGQYESVEIIREIPLVPCHSETGGVQHSSTQDAKGLADRETPRDGTEPILNADADPELNPVEWIMVTRSDPGGGIPRFLVERGTPPSIAADTVKFLDWACARPDNDEVMVVDSLTHLDERRPSYTSFHQSFTAGVNKDLDRPMIVNQHRDIVEDPEEVPGGLITSVASTISQTIVSNIPQVVRENMPGIFPGDQPISDNDSIVTSSSSAGSFASAEPYVTAETGDDTRDSVSTPTSSQAALGMLKSGSLSQGSFDSGASPSLPKDLEGHYPYHSKKDLFRIEQKKEHLERKLAAIKAKQEKAQRQAALKSEEESAKTREKHEHDMRRQEERHARQMAKLEERQKKEARKLESRRKKEEQKNKLLMAQRERDDWKQKAEMFEQENAILRERMGELQRENTLLVAKVGKAGESGHDLLRAVMEESISGQRRGTSIGSRGSRNSEDSLAKK